MNKVNLLTEFEEQGYDAILISSYTSDLVFFERIVLRQLLEFDCRYIGLFLDGKYILDNITDQVLHHIGKSYVVQPVHCHAAFHPKVYLLLGENKAKLLVGSGNLTPAGFITNTEVFNVINYNEDESEFLYLIQEAFSFFQYYHNLYPNKAMNSIMTKCEEFKYLHVESQPHPKVSFVHNAVEPIHEQIKRSIQTPISRIDVITPYFDRKLKVLDIWRKDFNPTEINILIQNSTSNFPKHLPEQDRTQKYLLEFTDSYYMNKRYHGKIFYFSGNKEDIVVYGSSNFSRQALLMSYNQGGNAEAVIIEKNSIGSFENFLSEQILRKPYDDIQVLTNDENTEIYTSISLHFLEAFKNNNEFIVCLSCNAAIEEASINNVLGLVEINDSIYIIKWHEHYTEWNSIISIEVKLNSGDIKTVFGWVHDHQALLNSQHNNQRKPYDELENDPYLTNYQTIVGLLEDLLERLILTDADLDASSKYKKKSSTKHIAAELSERNAQVSDNIDDYYVDEYELELEAYGSIAGTDVLSELIKRLLLPSFSLESPDDSIEQILSDPQTSKEHQIKVDGAIRKSLYDRMKRFTTRFKQGLTSDSYIKNVSEDVLITNIMIFTQFLIRFYNIPSDIPYISQEELIEELYEVSLHVIQYGKDNIIQHHHFNDKILPQFLATIVVKNQLIDKDGSIHNTQTTRKKMSLNLLDIHKIFHDLLNNTEIMVNKVESSLKCLKYNITKEDINFTLSKILPIINFDYFETWIRERDIKYELKVEDDISLRIYTNIKMNDSFNLDQLLYLAKLLKVEEWENHILFKIVWINENPDHNLKKFILYYYKKKSVMKKRYIYRNGNNTINDKRSNYYLGSIIDAAEKGNSQFIVFR